MANLRIARHAYTRLGTLGHLTGPGVDLYTVELPWRGNEVNRSCIPEGVYRYQRHHAPTLDMLTLWLPNVPGRTEILAHPADGPWQLNGCIAPARRYAYNVEREAFGAAESSAAMDELLEAAGDEGELEIFTWRPEYP